MFIGAVLSDDWGNGEEVLSECLSDILELISLQVLDGGNDL